MSDKAKAEVVTGGVDAIGVLPVVVVNAVDGALLSTGIWIWAVLLVPGCAGVAIG